MIDLVGSDWMTRLTQCHILYQDWLNSIVTSWWYHHPFISCHSCTIRWQILCSNCYWIGPSFSLGICQVIIMFFPSHNILYSALLTFLSMPHHMPLCLLTIVPHAFPWQHFPFISADSFVPMTHFISLTILPIIQTLLDPFVLNCHSIYGSHVCGVLSQPQFLYLSCIR